MDKTGCDTITPQNAFSPEYKMEAIENVGGRDRGRTGDLIVANDGEIKLRRGVAITQPW